jgi:hypothetical protein
VLGKHFFPKAVHVVTRLPHRFRIADPIDGMVDCLLEFAHYFRRTVDFDIHTSILRPASGGVNGIRGLPLIGLRRR